MSVIAYRRWRLKDGMLAPALVAWSPQRLWPLDGPATGWCEKNGEEARAMANWPSYQNDVRSRAYKTNLPAEQPGYEPGPHMGAAHKCGLWMHTDPIPVCSCPDPASVFHGVVGVVRAWGRYVRHESGWRFRHAQPVALVDFTGTLNPGYWRTARRYDDLEAMYEDWAPTYGEPRRWAEMDSSRWCGTPSTNAVLVTGSGYTLGSTSGMEFREATRRATEQIRLLTTMTIPLTVSPEAMRIMFGLPPDAPLPGATSM